MNALLGPLYRSHHCRGVKTVEELEQCSKQTWDKTKVYDLAFTCFVCFPFIVVGCDILMEPVALSTASLAMVMYIARARTEPYEWTRYLGLRLGYTKGRID